jgi:hypothetical protein
MKLVMFTISLLIVTLSLNGQTAKDTIVSISYIDSLKREVANLKERNNSMFWRFQEKANVTKIDTMFIRPDSSIITYSLKEGKPLKKQFNIHDKKGDIARYSNHYYNNKQQLKYIENWVNLKDDDFDAKLSSAERIEYDSLGRTA